MPSLLAVKKGTTIKQELDRRMKDWGNDSLADQLAAQGSLLKPLRKINKEETETLAQQLAR